MFPQNNETSGRPIAGMKLTDISGRLGLSVSTISRALRNAEGVDKRTRTRVLAEATKVGYRGQKRHSRFRDVDTRTILVLSRSDGGEMHYDAMMGMSRAAVHLNVSLLSHRTPEGAPESILDPQFQPPALRAGQVDGIVLAQEWPEDLVGELQRMRPVVSLFYEYPNVDLVGIDPISGMEQLLEHVTNCPGRRAGFHGHRASSIFSKHLVGGFLSACVIRGESHPPVVALDSRSASRKGLLKLVKAGVSAWICPDAASARRLSNDLESIGLTVPGDASIAVFLPTGPMPAVTSWTSLVPSPDDFGSTAIRCLLQRINAPAESRRNVFIEARVLPAGQASPSPQTSTHTHKHPK